MKESIIEMDASEMFDLIEALYTFAVLNHTGANSKLYGLQVEMRVYFNPRKNYAENEVVKDNLFYSKINEDNVESIWNTAKYVLDTRNSENVEADRNYKYL